MEHSIADAITKVQVRGFGHFPFEATRKTSRWCRKGWGKSLLITPNTRLFRATRKRNSRQPRIAVTL